MARSTIYDINLDYYQKNYWPLGDAVFLEFSSAPHQGQYHFILLPGSRLGERAFFRILRLVRGSLVGKSPRRASSRRGFQFISQGFSGNQRTSTPLRPPTKEKSAVARLDFRVSAHCDFPKFIGEVTWGDYRLQVLMLLHPKPAPIKAP